MSTTALVPSNCSNTNAFPSLRYLLSCKVSFDFSTRIVQRMGGFQSAVVAKLSPPPICLKKAGSAMFALLPVKVLGWADDARSEERRVGKEWRSRWSPYQ